MAAASTAPENLERTKGTAMLGRISAMATLGAIVLCSGCTSGAVSALTRSVRAGEFDVGAEIVRETPVSVTMPPLHHGCFASPKVCNVRVATVVDGQTRFEDWCVIMAVARRSGEYVPLGAWRRAANGWEKVDQKQTYSLLPQ